MEPYHDNKTEYQWVVSSEIQYHRKNHPILTNSQIWNLVIATWEEYKYKYGIVNGNSHYYTYKNIPSCRQDNYLQN